MKSALLLLLGLAPQDPAARAPVPAAEARQAAVKLVKEVFREDYAKRSPADKKLLALKLLEQAARTPDDPAGRYVLLDEARALAVEADDLKTALSAIEELARAYDVDRLSLTLAALLATGKAPEPTASSAERLLKLAEDALEQGAYDVAEKASTAAAARARGAKSIPLITRADSLSKEIVSVKATSDAARKAEQTLQAKPDDPEANLTLGRFTCVQRNDWAAGLPLLAKGSSEPLRALAAADLAGASDPGAQVALGDRWWDEAEKESGLTRKSLRRRAAHWYLKAAPSLQGLTAARVARRVEDADVPPPAEAPHTRLGFRGPSDLERFKLSGGTWSVEGGELVGSCRGDRQWATLANVYSSIDEVSLRVRIIPPAKNNLRLWVGPVHLIFNWEGAQQNLYRTNRALTTTPGHALVPGKEHAITLKQEGPNVLVSVDGQIVYRSATTLKGTVSLQAAHASKIGVRELKVLGVVDPATPAVPETRAAP